MKKIGVKVSSDDALALLRPLVAVHKITVKKINFQKLILKYFSVR